MHGPIGQDNFNEKKAKVREEIKSSLSSTNSDIYPDVSIRGI